MKNYASQIIVFLLALLIAPASTAFGQSQNKGSAGQTQNVILKGNVRDALTHTYLTETYVEVLSSADSTVLAADTCRDYSLMYAEEVRATFRADNSPVDYMVYTFNIPAGDYLLRFTRKGYNELIMPLSIPRKQHGFATKEWHAEDAMMQRVIERQLGEATVQATQIMMVHRGDTVVFNADYFQLAQGNMLDRLVSMLPGLEIKEGGQMYYHGNLLSNLLVNGKDFFNGDPKVALQNLPAYMVKNLKIYRRRKEGSFNVHKELTDNGKPNTLDVTLKREYSRGWMGNAEVAGGQRYLARLFSLYFSDRTQFGLIVNCNNISNNDEAGSDGAWKAAQEATNGIMQRAYGGIIFSHEWPKHGIKYDMNLKGTHDQTTTENATSSTSFLQTGDVFGRRFDNSTAKSSSLTFHNAFSWKTKKLWMSSPLDVEVRRSCIDSRLLSAAFEAEPYESYRLASLDSIFVGTPSQHLLDIITNKLDQTTTRTDQRLNLNYRINTSFKSPLLGNEISLGGKVHHTRLTGENTEDFRLYYPQTATDDLRDRLFKTSSNTTQLEASGDYSFNNMMSQSLADHLSAIIFYKFNYDNSLDSRTIRDGGVINQQGSYDRYSTQLKHELSSQLLFVYEKEWKNSLMFVPVINILNTKAEDTRSTLQVNRHGAYFNPILQYQLRRRNDDGLTLRDLLTLRYSSTTSPVSSYYLLDIHDATNPLSQMRGNTDLRYPTAYKLSASYQNGRWKGHIITLRANYQRIHDALAMGYTYTPETGSYTYRPENVQGNWSSSLGLNYQWLFGKDRRGALYTATNWNMVHSVDVVNSQISVVDNNGLSESMKLSYRFGTIATAALHANVLWQTAHSAREGFVPRSSVDLNYGPDINFKLPHDLQLSTDFSVLQRTGYDDPSMNDVNLIWNAALTWDFDFRRSSYYRLEWEDGFSRKVAGTGARPWSIRITAHDLLHQLSNTRRVLNAQGITETWTNSLPSYVMLHLTYRWNKQPKKK